MPQSKRSLRATAEQTTSPPQVLLQTQTIAEVIRATGNNLYEVRFPAAELEEIQDSETPSHMPVNATQTRSKNESERVVERSQSQVPRTEKDVIETQGLVELPSRFRNTIWLKRGSYVVVDREAFGDRENKLVGEIVNVVRNEREWRKMRYWPEQFAKKDRGADTDEEDSVVGKMPPEESDSDAEDEADK